MSMIRFLRWPPLQSQSQSPRGAESGSGWGGVKVVFYWNSHISSIWREVGINGLIITKEYILFKIMDLSLMFSIPEKMGNTPLSGSNKERWWRWSTTLPPGPSDTRTRPRTPPTPSGTSGRSRGTPCTSAWHCPTKTNKWIYYRMIDYFTYADEDISF